jgi:hypothetical protein
MKKIKIAVCPTYHKMAKNINAEEYEFVETNSTAESLNLLKNNTVDMILAGRVLKPSEPKLKSLLIKKEGYSFLSDQVKKVSVKDLNNYDIYTDLLDVALVKENFSIKKVHQVDDVYKFLSKGIVITSWENTDYARAEIVHVLESSGERAMLSRRPTLYFSMVYEKDANKLMSVLKQAV